MEINKFNLKLSLLIPLWYYFLGSAENQNQHSTSYYRKKNSSKKFVEKLVKQVTLSKTEVTKVNGPFC